MVRKTNETLVAALRALCAGLPAVTQDVKWEEVLVFSVGNKMFATTHTDGSDSFSFKVDADHFLELTDRPGIIPAPYMARFRWVRIADPKALSLEEAIAPVKRSYQLVFAKLSKKLQREIGHE